jgi:hypothetical protein
MGLVKEIWQADKDGVKQVRIEELQRVSHDEFVRLLQDNKISTPILPYGTIWYEHNNTDKIYVIQLPPKKRTIPYYDKYYELGFPSMVIAVKVSGAMIANVGQAIALRPIDNFDTDLFRLPMPNMDNRGFLCMGFDFDMENTHAVSEVQRVRNVIEHIETSKYNNHLLPIGNWIPDKIRGDYKFTAQLTAGPDDILKAQTAYYKVLEEWATLTTGDGWLQAVANMGWAPLRKFSEFVRGGGF